MHKWFKEQGINQDIVISSRVRLARNLSKYAFLPSLTEDKEAQLVQEVLDSLKEYSDEEGKYIACNLTSMSEVDKLAMVERHIIRPVMANRNQTSGLVISENENCSIMVNEEDHIRIQGLAGGMNLEKAYERANRLDDYIYEKLPFAYDDKYGYLTTSPTNAGTGLRASYLLFLPALAAASKISRLAEEISKYSVSLKGVYGEGTDYLAAIYQISNEKTLGSSETDIMNNLNSIVMQVMKQERKRREYMLATNYDEIEDHVYRSYGVLKYAKQMNSKDAMTLLSQIKFGIDTGMLELASEINVYELMMTIQPSNLQYKMGKNAGSAARDKYRAEYISKTLPALKQDLEIGS